MSKRPLGVLMVSMFQIASGGLLLFVIFFGIASDATSGQSIIALVGLPVALAPIWAGIYLLQMTEDGRFVNVVTLSIFGLFVLCLGLHMMGEEESQDLPKQIIVLVILLGLGLCALAYYLTRPAIKAQFRQ